jgi:hypothetical protein
MGQEERRNKAKLEKTQLTVASSNAEYKNSVKALEDTTYRWNREWKAAADKFQDLEEERLDFTKSSLWQFANISSTVCVSDDASCEKIRLSLEGLDIEQDIAVFIKESGTGQVIPDAPKYINFCRGDLNENIGDDAADDDTYSVAQFPRDINPAFRSSSPQPSTYESHHDPQSTLANSLVRRDQQLPMATTGSPSDYTPSPVPDGIGSVNTQHEISLNSVDDQGRIPSQRHLKQLKPNTSPAMTHQAASTLRHTPQTSSHDGSPSSGQVTVLPSSSAPDQRLNILSPAKLITPPENMPTPVIEVSRVKILDNQRVDRAMGMQTAITSGTSHPTYSDDVAGSSMTAATVLPHSSDISSYDGKSPGVPNTPTRPYHGPVKGLPGCQTTSDTCADTHHPRVMTTTVEKSPRQRTLSSQESGAAPSIVFNENPGQQGESRPLQSSKPNRLPQTIQYQQSSRDHNTDDYNSKPVRGNNNSPFRRKSTQERTDHIVVTPTTTISPGRYSETATIATRSGTYDQERSMVAVSSTVHDRSMSPDPIDVNASVALNIGRNVFTVEPPGSMDNAIPAGVVPVDETVDPIVSALAQLKGRDKPAMQVPRMSADHYHGIATPVSGTYGHGIKPSTERYEPHSHLSKPAKGTQSSHFGGTPPPSYEPVTAPSQSAINSLTSAPTPQPPPSFRQSEAAPATSPNPVHRLGVPPPAVTSRAMREASKKVADQSRHIFGSSPTLPSTTTRSDPRGQDLLRSVSPAAQISPQLGPADHDAKRRSTTPSSSHPQSRYDGTSSQHRASSENDKHNAGNGSSEPPDHFDGPGGQRGRRPGTSGSSRPTSPYSSVNQAESLRRRSRSIADPSRQYTRDGHPILHYARAIYMYRAAIPQELGFAKGDILAIIAHQDDGWWRAELQGPHANGQSGLVPSNYLQPR